MIKIDIKHLLCWCLIFTLNIGFSQDCPVFDASFLNVPCYNTGTCPGTMASYGFDPPQTGWAISGGAFTAGVGNPGYAAVLNSNTSTLTYSNKNCGVSTVSFQARRSGSTGTSYFVIEVNSGNGWVYAGTRSTNSGTWGNITSDAVNLYGNNIRVRVRVTSRTDKVNLLIDNFSINDYSLTGTITESGCNICSGEQLTLGAWVSGLKLNEQIDWYQSASNPPYPGGTLIGSSAITTSQVPVNELEPGDECPKLVAIFIDACNGTGDEPDNEFVILTSGSGFSVPNFSLDLPNNGGTNGGDIGQGNPCPIQAPSATLWANVNDCALVRQGNPSQVVPANSFVLVFTSSQENVDYDLSQICALGHDIYVFQSGCARTQGAFVNGDGSGTRTTTANFSDVGCSNSITYDADDPAIDPPSDGDMVYLDNNNSLVYANNGCTVLPLNNINLPIVYRSDVAPFNFNSTCSGTKYVQGVISMPSCADVLTSVYTYNVICPLVNKRDTTICAGASVNLASLTSVSGGNADVIRTYHSGTPADNTNLLPSSTVSPSSTYTYYVKADYLGKCSDTKPVTVTVAALPTANAGASPNPVCINSNLNLTSSGGTNYQWSGPNGFSSSQQNPTVNNIQSNQAGIYTVTVTNTAGCSATATVNVQTTVCACANPPVADAGPDKSICAGQVASLSGTVNTTPTWYSSGDGTFSAPNNVNTNYTPGAGDIAAGSVVLNLIANDPDGSGPCEADTNSMVLTINSIPVLNLSGNITLCSGDCETVQINVTGGSGANDIDFILNYGLGTFPFTVNDLASGSSINLCYVGSAPGWDPVSNTLRIPTSFTGTITLRATRIEDSNTGCLGTAIGMLSITLANKPTPSISAPNIACINGGLITLSGTPSGGVFSGPGVTGNQFDPLVAGLGDQSITYSVTQNGCTGEAMHTIRVVDMPVVSINPLPMDTFCMSDPQVNLSASPSGGNFTGPGVSGASFTPSAAGGPGQKLIIYSYTDGNGCVGKDTLTLEVIACGCDNLITIDAGHDTTICINQPLIMSGFVSSGQGTWSSTSIDGTFSDIHDPNATYIPGFWDRAYNDIQMTFTSEDPDGAGPCLPVSDVIRVHLNAGGSIDFSGAISLCANECKYVKFLVNQSEGPFRVNVRFNNGAWPLDSGYVGVLNQWDSIRFCYDSPDWLVFDSTTHTVHIPKSFFPVTFNATLSGVEDLNNGCGQIITGQVNITLRESPTVDIIGNLEVCPGYRTTLFAGTGFTTYRWSNGASTNTITTGAPGTYSVTVTNAGGCSAADTVTVVRLPAPDVSISGSTSYCVGGYTRLDAGPGFLYYDWSNGEETQTIDANQPGLYSVTVTAQNGCTATSTIVISELDRLHVDITGDTAVCPNQNTTLIATPGFATYEWSTGNTDNIIQTNGVGLYSVTVTDATGCTGTDEIAVIYRGNLDLNIQGSRTFCPGGQTRLDAGSFATYEWSTGSNASQIFVNVPGVYSVTVTSAEGCTGSASVSISEGPGLTPTITGDTALCIGETTFLDAGTYETYIWSTGSQSRTITVADPGVYYVTVMDNMGCTGTDSLIVKQRPPLAINIAGSSTFCAGGSTTLDAGAGYRVYNWSTGENTRTIVVSDPGFYEVSVTDNNGCTGKDTITVSEGTTLNFNIVGPPQVCNGGSATLDAGPGFASYSWSTGATSQTINVNSSGIYSVTVSDAGGCTGTDEYTLTISPPLLVNINGSSTFCAGSGTTLDAGADFASYNWSTGATTRTITVNSSGTYRVTVTDANGCTGTDDISVTQSSALTINIQGNNSICFGQNTVLDPGSGFVTYSWSTGANTQTITVNASGTYSVTVTDAGGCSGTDDITITVGAPLNINITGTAQICDGSSSTLDAGAGFANYSWSTGATTRTIVVNNSGTYIVTVTDASGCTGTDDFSVTKAPKLTPAIIGSTTFCAGSTTSLDAGSGYSAYLWSTGASTQVITVSLPGTYIVTVTDASGCTGTDDITVTQSNALTISIGGDDILCFGDNTILDPGPGFATYSWSTGATTRTITVSAPGMYEVTVTDASGCSGSDDIFINILPEVKPSISGANQICTGSTTILDAGAGYTTYLWSGGETSQTITVSAAGTYNVTVTNTAGCSGTASMTVTVSNAISVSISGNSSFCDGQSTVLDAGAGFTTYSWSNGQSTRTISVNASGNYQVTVSDASGCSGTGSINVTKYPAVNVSIGGSNTYCTGGSTILDAGAGFVLYSWSNGATTQTISVNSEGTYSVTVTDVNGCTGVTSMLVKESNSLTILISGEPKICEGNSTVLNAGAGFASYQWSTGESTSNISVSVSGTYMVTVFDGSGCSGVGSFTVDVISIAPIVFNVLDTVCVDDPAFTLVASPFGGVFSGKGVNGSTFNPATAGEGLHTIIYTYTNAPCSKTDSVKIFVKNCNCAQVITVNAGNDKTVCADETKVSLNGIVNGSSDIIWTSSGSGIFNPNNAQATEYTFSAADIAAGNITLTLTANDPDGAGPCSAIKDMMNVLINPLPVISGIDVNQPDCNTSTGSATINVLPGSAKISLDGGSTFITGNTVNNLSPGNYTVIVITAAGCMNESSFSVSKPSVFNPDWRILSKLCADVGSNTFILDDPNLDLPVTIILNGEDKGSFSSVPAKIEDLDFGNYTISIIDASGCIKDSSFSFTNSDNLDIEIQDLYTIEEGQEVVLNPSITGNYAVISWTPPLYLSCDDCPNPVSKPDSTIQYFVLVDNGQGCTDLDSVTIKVNPSIKIYIPNTFSPNHDGINDKFSVHTYDPNIIIRDIRIFNRWGDQVYGVTNLAPNQDNGWDGTFKGKPVNPDVFVYYIKLEFPDKSTSVLKGSITVIE